VRPSVSEKRAKVGVSAGTKGWRNFGANAVPVADGDEIGFGQSRTPHRCARSAIHAAALRDLPNPISSRLRPGQRCAEGFAQRFGARAYTDLGTLLRDARPHALVVCTPHPLHAAPVIQAARWCSCPG